MSLLLLVLGALAVGGPLLAQQAEERLDYLNERLRIPESERYSEESYIESGVGLTFGVDRRLSYYPGNYTEATAQFEAAVKRFRYKAEIWVFLSRAYFFMKAPESARDALFRAAEVMPDLSERLWGPLTRGLEWEIRQRANAQRVQADYYSTDQGGFLSLFRLYRFLADTAGAAEVVRSADRRALQMHQGAGMVSAASREAQLAEAARWSDLADSLRLELVAMGGQADLQGAEAASGSLDLAEGPDPVPERLRILQLKS
ncbi:MAG: tetratricopeptide repeat protein, partial [Gemmatimonadota bacterium]